MRNCRHYTKGDNSLLENEIYRIGIFVVLQPEFKYCFSNCVDEFESARAQNLSLRMDISECDPFFWSEWSEADFPDIQTASAQTIEECDPGAIARHLIRH